MSKRGRRERREGQLARAIESGDLAVLEAQSAGSPGPVLRALGAPPSDPVRAAALDALAGRLAKRLRLSGRAADALRVAAAGRRRTAGLRMEEALAAFALERDEIAAAVAGEDERVGAVVGPLLRGARGEVEQGAGARAPAGGRDGGAGSAFGAATQAELRALHAAARAVGQVVRGEGAQARKELRRIERALQGKVLAGELAAAVDVADPERAIEGVKRLGRSSIARAPGGVRRAVIAEAAAHASPGILEALSRSFPDASKEEVQLATVPVARARLLSPRSVAAAADAVRDVDLGAFPAAERGTAALYKGYGLLGSAPEAAARSFDAAIGLGADLVEALRGKLLAAIENEDEDEDEDEDGAGAHEGKRMGRDVAAAAERLGRALRRDARGRPLTAAAEQIAAEAWIMAGDGRAAAGAIARARAAGAEGAALDELEVQALTLKDPGAARARIEALLDRDRTDVEVWRMKIAFVRARGGETFPGETVIEAAKATGDPELVDEARRVRSRRGEVAPFEGLTPGAVTAGALAKELARVDEESASRGGRGERGAQHDAAGALARGKACRDALAPAGRLAFDAAAFAIAAGLGNTAEARRRLREALGAWREAPRDLARIAAVAVQAGLEEEVVREARSLAGDAPALTAIAEALIASGKGSQAQKLLPFCAAHLSRFELDRLRGLSAYSTSSGVEIPGVPGGQEAARELDLALAPEHSILAFLRKMNEEARRGEAPRVHPRHDSDELSPREVAEEVLSLFGVEPGALDRLSAEEQRKVEREIGEMLQRPPSFRSAERIVEMIMDMRLDRPAQRAPAREEAR